MKKPCRPRLGRGFSGKITTWNHAALAKASGAPRQAASWLSIAPTSGSTYTFTGFLSKVSEPWKKSIGQGASVPWPVGEGAAGNEALAELVKKTPSSIGYVVLNYAVEKKLKYDSVMNAAGKFQKANLMRSGPPWIRPKA